YLPYGATDDRTEPLCEVLATLGPVETEYASIRRAAGVLDSPHRATIEVRGADARDFLDRMLTAKLADMAVGDVRPAFWLNRQGRIEADLLLARLDDRFLADVDVAQAGSAVAALGDFVFTEDVEVVDRSDEVHQLAVHGRLALEVVAAAADHPGWTVDDRRAATLTIAGATVPVARCDAVGQCGLLLFCPVAAAPAVVEQLLAADAALGQGRRRVRPVGWLAWNIARIEAGTPVFNVDFGPTNLPHETGVLDDRVSFAKGCYPGQEVVARLHNLGRPKQQLVGLRIDGDGLPVAGAQVFEQAEGGMGDQVGVVTSSTLSPMLGAAPIAFAMVRAASAEPGATVLVNAEGAQERATVAPLRFWAGDGEEPASC
ncbi:MAG: CAF17-like 4Fe-4S cluster assembly/insertion protein YgfZ, partial [Planctomycetota bacterium]